MRHQMDHAARPTMLFDLRGKFNDFLEEASGGSDDFPKSLEKLLAVGIKLVQADANDPDGLCLKF